MPTVKLTAYQSLRTVSFEGKPPVKKIVHQRVRRMITQVGHKPSIIIARDEFEQECKDKGILFDEIQAILI